MPQLSILIPAIPSRFDRAHKLYNKILEMVSGMDIEVLLLFDNKKRTIGLKREALKNIGKGKYFMFVDDDDSLLTIHSVYEATFKDVDVITFKQRCQNKDKSTYIVTFNLGNEIEHNQVNGIYQDSKRPPWHVCAWHSKFKIYEFPDISYGEDWGWLQQILPLARTEEHIDEIVSSYNWDPMVTEASTANNIQWQNPNYNEPVKRCVVSLATNTSKYLDGLRRLRSSVNTHAKKGQMPIDFFAFVGEDSVGAPTHQENPYAFKLYAIQKARDQGYNQVLWLDNSVVEAKYPLPVFEWLTKSGIFLEEAGHWAGRWCNDKTLQYFGITRAAAMQMPMFAAGYCGFDFRNPISIEFFAQWKESMLNGCFRGSWSDHRHDMTCGSIIANKLDLVPRYSPGGQFFAYIGPAYGEPSPTACYHLLGL